MPLFSGASVLNSSILRDRGGRGQMRGRMHKFFSSTCSTGINKGTCTTTPTPKIPCLNALISLSDKGLFFN